MNRHQTITINTGTTLVGLTLAAAMTMALGSATRAAAAPARRARAAAAARRATGSAGATAGTGGSSAGPRPGQAAPRQEPRFDRWVCGRHGGSTTGGTGGSSAGGTGGSAPWLTLPANLPPDPVRTGGGDAQAAHARHRRSGLHLHRQRGGGTGGSGVGVPAAAANDLRVVLKQPDAKLYDESNTQVGTHGLGPNWTSTVDGSVINGAKAYQETPQSDANPVALAAGHGEHRHGRVHRRHLRDSREHDRRQGARDRLRRDHRRHGHTGWLHGRLLLLQRRWSRSGVDDASREPAGRRGADGATLKIHDHAIGVQVYTCTASAAGGAGGGAGTAARREAGRQRRHDLFVGAQAARRGALRSSFAQVGTHGAGPNWTSTVDASVVNAARLAQSPSTMTGAIPCSCKRRRPRARACSATSPTYSG